MSTQQIDAAVSSPFGHMRVPEHPIDPQFDERWSPRSFTDETIDVATLNSMVEAARWAASSYNSQPWRFVYALCGDEHFQNFVNFLAPPNQRWAGKMAALVMLASDTMIVPPGSTSLIEGWFTTLDTGAAAANFIHQASSIRIRGRSTSMRCRFQVIKTSPRHCSTIIRRTSTTIPTGSHENGLSPVKALAPAERAKGRRSRSVRAPTPARS